MRNFDAVPDCGRRVRHSFGARRLFVPDVIAISVTEVTQPLWALELAFLLLATENIAALGAILVLVAAAVQWFTRRRAAA